MLRLSKLTDYGIVVMTCLATKPDSLHAANSVADCTHISLPTVSKLLKQLNRAGLVEAIRGSKGGYQLNRPAREISVAEVIAALEGPVSLTECSTASSHCDQEEVCSVRGNWEKINKAISGALEDVSMAEMAGVEVQVNFEQMVTS